MLSILKDLSVRRASSGRVLLDGCAAPILHLATIEAHRALSPCDFEISAEVFPMLVASSYSTVWPSFKLLRPARSTAERRPALYLISHLAENKRPVRSCLIDGEAIVCDEERLAVNAPAVRREAEKDWGRR